MKWLLKVFSLLGVPCVPKHYVVDMDKIYGSLLTGWNLGTAKFKAFHTCVGILVDWEFKSFDQSIYFMNCYGPYKNIDFFLE